MVKKDRLAFMGKAGDSLGKVPVMNKVPRSMRFIVLIVILVVVIAAIAVGLPKGDDGPTAPSTLVVDDLEDYSWTSASIDGTVNEFSSASFNLADFIDSNGTLFIDKIDVTVTWTDEPDQTWMGRTRENLPDHIAVEILVGEGTESFSVISEFGGNAPGSKQGTVIQSMDLSSTNFTFVMMGNATGVDLPDGLLMGGINIIVWMDEAEDLYASGPAAFKLNDTGNAFSLTITISGKTF